MILVDSPMQMGIEDDKKLGFNRFKLSSLYVVSEQPPFERTINLILTFPVSENEINGFLSLEDVNLPFNSNCQVHLLINKSESKD